HPDRGATLVIDVDRGTLRRRIDLHRELPRLVTGTICLGVRCARENRDCEQQRHGPGPYDTRTNNRHRVPSLDGRMQPTSPRGAAQGSCAFSPELALTSVYGASIRVASAPSSASPVTTR